MTSIQVRRIPLFDKEGWGEIFSRAPQIPPYPPFLKGGIVKRGPLMSVMASQGLHGRRVFCFPLSGLLGKWGLASAQKRDSP